MHLLKNFHNLVANNSCFLTRDLAISGNEIMNFGFKGKDIGKVLGSLLYFVMEGKLSNTKEELSEFIKKNNFF